MNATISSRQQGHVPLKTQINYWDVYNKYGRAKGHDDGSYQRIREKFLEKVELLHGTKPPIAGTNRKDVLGSIQYRTHLYV